MTPGDVARVVLAASGVAVVGSLAFRARAIRPATTRRDPLSVVGLVLEAAAFAALLLGRDASATLPATLAAPHAWATVALAAALLAASIALVDRALAELGSQWRVIASVAGDDRLVTSGPYRIVRHPVYAGVLGILAGSGVLLASPGVLTGAMLVGGAGTWIRIRCEDGLLRERFGADFAAYARDVPALFPRLSGGRAPS